MMKKNPECFRCIQKECKYRNLDARCSLPEIDLRDGECHSYAGRARYKWCYTADELPDDAITSADMDMFDFIKMAESGDFEIYTQVDSEVDDGIVYLAGKHVVNRTGVYALLPKVRQ
jgi:hypothetical protein